VKSKHKKSKGGKGPRPRQVSAIADGIKLTPGRWLVPVIVALLTGVAFLPALQGEFLNWDDDRNFLLNFHYRGLGLDQLRWMFTAFHMGHYTPLTWMTLGLDYLLSGMDPAGYHLTNLLLHGATAVAFYFLTIQLLRLATGSVGEDKAVWVGAAFAALLFAVHPLRVESVAWITERRDVLSGLFYVLTILAYLRGSDGVGRGVRWYWVSVVLCACALLSKSMAVSVPVVLLILDVYPLKRLGGSVGWWNASARHVYREKIPFVLLAGVVSAVAFAAQFYSTALASLDKVSPLKRLAISGYGLGFYLWKTVIPLNLSPIYEVPIKINPFSPTYIWSYILVLIFMVLTLVLRHRLPALLASWLAYLVILLPVTGIVQAGPQIAADRYTYISFLGWAIMAGAGLYYCWRPLGRRRLGPRTFVFINGVAAVLVVGLGGLTWTQAQVWHDSETLWRHAVSAVPESNIAHNNLGDAMFELGELAEAMKHYRQALRINPNYATAHNNLGNAMLERGELGEAIKHYRQALRINPAYVEAHNNLGNVMLKRGELGEAIEHYRQALRVDPTHSLAHYNLGNALLKRGELAEAMKHYRQALQIDPAYVEAHNNLGNAMLKRGELGEAIKHFRQALRINPAHAQAHYNLGNAMVKRGELGEAIKHFRQALQIDPAYVEAHNNLGVALLRGGMLTEATEHFCQALRLGYASAQQYLTAALAQHGKREDAVEVCRELQRNMQPRPAEMFNRLS